jgi:Polysaccharide biosynthesis/export protein
MNFTGSIFFSSLALIWVIHYTSIINAQQRRVEPQQDRPASQSSTSEPRNSSVLTDAEKDYRISAGDVIQIQIEEAPELSHYYRVNSSGLIEMPEPIGLIEARKNTTSELARVIANRPGRRINRHPWLISLHSSPKQNTKAGGEKSTIEFTSQSGRFRSTFAITDGR